MPDPSTERFHKFEDLLTFRIPKVTVDQTGGTQVDDVGGPSTVRPEWYARHLAEPFQLQRLCHKPELSEALCKAVDDLLAFQPVVSDGWLRVRLPRARRLRRAKDELNSEPAIEDAFDAITPTAMDIASALLFPDSVDGTTEEYEGAFIYSPLSISVAHDWDKLGSWAGEEICMLKLKSLGVGNIDVFGSIVNAARQEATFRWPVSRAMHGNHFNSTLPGAHHHRLMEDSDAVESELNEARTEDTLPGADAIIVEVRAVGIPYSQLLNADTT